MFSSCRFMLAAPVRGWHALNGPSVSGSYVSTSSSSTAIQFAGDISRVERGTSRHAKKPAIVDTGDPERDKGSCIAYLDVQFFNHYVPTLQLRLRENALSVHEYVLNDGIGCLTSCNRGTGLDISSERCFRLKIIQRDKSAQQQHNAHHTKTNNFQKPGHTTSPIGYG
ncbi:Uncharacterised protein [Klebsiella pneumoniae]|nr:Uncharacterised protein [Klebsiella pneumoniae]STU16527.1 Uncharacterised protein [Klebsiella pneumoniae]STU16698.1 Uncharacterised protein [Klebsiella pneumoniae]STU17034.1 Uncharacterised protein [Klebsiella pneumoniae]